MKSVTTLFLLLVGIFSEVITGKTKPEDSTKEMHAIASKGKLHITEYHCKTT